MRYSLLVFVLQNSFVVGQTVEAWQFSNGMGSKYFQTLAIFCYCSLSKCEMWRLYLEPRSWDSVSRKAHTSVSKLLFIWRFFIRTFQEFNYCPTVQAYVNFREKRTERFQIASVLYKVKANNKSTDISYI